VTVLEAAARGSRAVDSTTTRYGTCGLAASGKEAVQSFAEQRPEVTLMDLDLPSGAGITAIQEILKVDPAACVLGLFTYEGDESRTRALRAGARDCLTKDRLNEDLVALVRNCARPAG